MEDGQGAVKAAMDPHPDLDIMAAILIRRDLQDFPFKADTVVAAYGSLELFAQDVVQIGAGKGDEGAAFFSGGLLEPPRGVQPDSLCATYIRIKKCLTI